MNLRPAISSADKVVGVVGAVGSVGGTVAVVSVVLSSSQPVNSGAMTAQPKAAPM